MSLQLKRFLSKFEFSANNLAKIKEILQKYPTQYKKAAVIPLLDLGQRQNNNYTSMAVMNEVARILEMPLMRVYEVATFYSMFNQKPVGKYHVQVCTTTPCELCGASLIVEAIQNHLKINVGETTTDNLFTLGEVECAGACVNAPMMAINDNYYEDLTPETAIDILKKTAAGNIPNPGPQSKRKGCEPLIPSSLQEEPPGPGYGMQKL